MTYHKILMKLHLGGPLKIIGLMDNVSVLNVTEASLSIIYVYDLVSKVDDQSKYKYITTIKLKKRKWLKCELIDLKYVYTTI